MNRPFDEAKYKALLKGQTDFSIINLSEIEKMKKRIDSEYYQRRYLELENKINLIGKINIKGINARLDCSAFYPSITDYYNFEFEGVPFLRVNEIQNGLVTITQNTAFLPQEILDNNSSTIAIAYPDDIVIAKGGNTLAKLGLVTNQYPYYSLSRDLILLKTKNLRNCNKYFLWVFLHSKYGQDLLWRTASQTGQPHLTLPAIEEIGLPRYSDKFEGLFENLYQQSIEIKQKSKEKYQQAENLLLEAVGLKDFEPSRQQTSVKSLKESFLTTGRLDAEFYQPKYEQYQQFFAAQSDGKVLGNLAALRKGYQARSLSETGTLYASIKDADSFLVETTERTNQSDLVLIEPNEIVLAITGATIGKTGINASKENIAISGDLVGIKPFEISPYYLQIVLSSKPIQEMCRQFTTGATNGHLTVSDVASFPVPLIEDSIQDRISQNVISAIEKRKQSKKLLEIAKRAVEIAIEETEEKAIEFINEETNHLAVN